MSPATATAPSPLDGLKIHHDSTVAVIDGPRGDDNALLYDVDLDGNLVGCRLDRVDADHYAADIERAIRRAQLVHGIRELADFIEARPELPLPRVSAGIYIYDDNVEQLATLAEQLGEYRVRIDNDSVIVQRDFPGRVDIHARGYELAIPEIVDGKVVYRAPDLPGRNLAAEGPAS